MFSLSLLFSECSVGTYSEGLANGACLTCPPNSEATQTGLAECRCDQDYYRAPNEGPSANCTRECSTYNQYQSTARSVVVLLDVFAPASNIGPCTRKSSTSWQD